MGIGNSCSEEVISSKRGQRLHVAGAVAAQLGRQVLLIGLSEPCGGFPAGAFGRRGAG